METSWDIPWLSMAMFCGRIANFSVSVPNKYGMAWEGSMAMNGMKPWNLGFPNGMLYTFGLGAACVKPGAGWQFSDGSNLKTRFWTRDVEASGSSILSVLNCWKCKMLKRFFMVLPFWAMKCYKMLEMYTFSKFWSSNIWPLPSISPLVGVASLPLMGGGDLGFLISGSDGQWWICGRMESPKSQRLYKNWQTW